MKQITQCEFCKLCLHIFLFQKLIREAAKKSYFLIGSAIKRGGGKGLPLWQKWIYFIFSLKD